MGNPDSKNSNSVFDIFKHPSHERGQTFIAVTHDEDFEKNSVRVIELSDGSLIKGN